MTQLGRSIKVSISDNLSTKVFDERFFINATVQKSLDNTVADTCNIDILNVNRANRDFLGSPDLVMLVEAGYEGRLSTLHAGDVQTVVHRHEGPDWVTSIQAGDGVIALQTSFMNKTYNTGAKLEQTLGDIAGSMGMELELIGADQTFKDTVLQRGKSYTLDSKMHIDQIAKQHDLDWALQDGTLVVGRKGQHREGDIIKLDYASGLLFSPTVEVDDKTKRINLKATALLQPGLRPGDRVAVVSDALKGTVGNTQISKDNSGSVEINIKTILFVASSREGDFICDIEGAVV